MSVLPFSAVVGQDDARLALLLGAVDPGIGGVLLTGEKGTAKTTLVRGLRALLPDVFAVAGCRFACDPSAPDPRCPDGPHTSPLVSTYRPAALVELPLGATDDRVTGSLDVPRVLAGASTQEAFAPGLLAAAHRGVLYVDEVNLLPDHLVDVLLDAAATGRTTVEREGLSLQHASSFLLLGTMNPEEGELRPQLLDRFGLSVAVTASTDPAQRAAAVRARLSHDSGAAVANDDQLLTARLVAARALLPSVVLPDRELLRITAACSELGIDGLRGDLVTARTALAHAAWEGRTAVTGDDVRAAARLALAHRQRRTPFDDPGTDAQKLEDALGEDEPTPPPGGGAPPPGPGDGGGPPSPPDPSDAGADPAGGAPPAPPAEQPEAPAPEGVSAEAGPAVTPRVLRVAGTGDGPAGRRSRSAGDHGRPVAARRTSEAPELLPTLRAAALDGWSAGAPLRPPALRRSVRRGREANLVVLVLDTSGSLAARRRSADVGSAALSLLGDAYRRRDRVALVTVSGAGATVVVPPTGSVDLAARRLRRLPVGGLSPLDAGLLEALALVRREGWRDPGRRPLLVLVTDGRATGPGDALGRARAAADRVLRAGVASVVVDVEDGPVRLRLAADLAARMGGEHVPLGALGARPGEGLAARLRAA